MKQKVVENSMRNFLTNLKVILLHIILFTFTASAIAIPISSLKPAIKRLLSHSYIFFRHLSFDSLKGLSKTERIDFLLQKAVERGILKYSESLKLRSYFINIENGDQKLLELLRNLEEKQVTSKSGRTIVLNKMLGLSRETQEYERLKRMYPPSKGYKIYREQYLRDQYGNIVRDPITGEARRIDFVVVKDGKVIKTIEVTSKTAPKESQLAKEARIKNMGGIYIRDEETGELIQIPSNVKTEIRRYE